MVLQENHNNLQGGGLTNYKNPLGGVKKKEKFHGGVPVLLKKVCTKECKGNYEDKFNGVGIVP